VPKIEGSSVTFHVDVNEGKQYHVRSVKFTGVSAETAAKLQSVWELPVGSVYNADYPEKFLTKLLTTFRGNVAFEAEAQLDLDEAAQGVDVTVALRPKRAVRPPQ
jgi:outer membrane protein assembly factor BamA